MTNTRMTEGEKVKQAFGALHASDNINLEIKRRKRNRRKGKGFVKAVVAVAACAAIVLSSVSFSDRFINKPTNSFTINAYAAELEEGKAVPVTMEGNPSCWTIDKEFGDETTIKLNFPVTIQGENIEKITYSIANGAFSVLNPVGEQVVAEGERIELDYGYVYHQEYYKEPEHELVCEQEHNNYKTLSIAYDKQTGDLVFFDIVNEKIYDDGKIAAIWDNEASVQDKIAALDYVFGEMDIECKVTFKGGEVETQTIHFKGHGEKSAELFCYIGDDPKEFESVAENDTSNATEDVSETENVTELTTQMGDTIVVREEVSETPAELQGDVANYIEVNERKKITIDVTEPEFAQWDWEPTEEDIMPNVQEAIGLKVGDSFTISFEYGDGRVYHTYTILEIHR